MSNYFDNQSTWNWNIDKDHVTVTTEHTHPKPHSHTLDITNVPIGEMVDNPGKVMGQAHRAASHDYKLSEETGKMGEKSTFLERIRCDQATIDRVSQVGKKAAQTPASAKRADEGGRERGDDGPGKMGRESGLKVGTIRADMNATAKAQPQGSLSQDGKAVNSSGKSTTAGPSATMNSGKGAVGYSGGSGVSGSTGGHGSGSGGSGGTGGHGSGSGGSGGTGGHGSGSGGSGGTGGHGGSGGHGGH